jgi:hypothetical protein
MKYFIENNFLKQKDCEKIINFYNENKEKTYKHGSLETGTIPLNIVNIKNNLFKKILDKIKNKYFKYFLWEKISNFEIVCWPVGSYMDPHFDKGDKCGFFIYLNDDYEGGQTDLINIKIIEPKIGKLLIFNNSDILHKVNKVIKKDRYTLAGWCI